MVERLTVNQETKDRYLPYTQLNTRVVKLENTTDLSSVASACRFDSCHGYNWSYSLIGKTYRYER
jgi:hypothetical protein